MNTPPLLTKTPRRLLALLLIGGPVVVPRLPAQVHDTMSHRPASAWRLTPGELTSSCRSAITRTHAAVESVVAPGLNLSSLQKVQQVEEAVGELATVTTWPALLYLISPDAGLRDSSAACNQAVINFGVELSADPRIYLAAQQALHDSLPTPADRQLAQRYVEAGRRGGGGLDSVQRARSTALFQRLNDLQRDFGIALAQDSSSIVIGLRDSVGLPAQLRAGFHPAGDGLLVPVNNGTRQDFMAFERNPDARLRYLVAYDNRGGPANVARLRTVLALRDTLAHLLGFQTWAAYQLDNKMAKTPERVMRFLEDIRAKLRPKAEAEFARLAPLAKQDGRPVPVVYADYYYYLERLRRTKYALESDQIRNYFPVDHVIQSVMALYQELFGLRFTEARSADVWAPGVRAFSVRDAGTGKTLGRLYLDLFPRPNKYEHFADFPIYPARRLPDGSRQLASTAIIGNWPTGAPGRPTLLSHSDLITFFHEFGHAMAAVLDGSPYVTTGTGNLRQDFGEAPSQMLENWMWQPAILRRVSRHVKTGRPLPHTMIKRMLALKHLEDGWGWSRQAFLATYDMRLHTSSPTVDPTALYRQLFAEITPVTEPDSTVPEAGFGHLMGYDAGYYGYLWAKVYAQDMFSRFEREGILNPRPGRAYRDNILAWGAVLEPEQLVKHFLGRPLSYDAFYRELGISQSDSVQASETDGPALFRRHSQ
jgi:oligopeptidase A